MDFKIICFLLITIITLRTGFVESANTYDNENSANQFKRYDGYMITTTNASSSSIIPDKCAESGIINNCTLESPYCFIYGDNFSCGHTGDKGWRISPSDGLILNNDSDSDSYCELFIPPERFKTREIIMNLLSDSEFGLKFKNRKSAWFNIFENLGNCPRNSQFCNSETITCQALFEVGNNCSSSNQCLTHYCERYNKRERRCVDENDTKESLEEKRELSKEKVKILLIIIAMSVGSSILILEVTICFVKAQRKKRFLLNLSKNDQLPPFSSNYLHSSIATRHLTSLHSSLISRISFRHPSKNKRSSSDYLSVLLPPPPTLNRDSFNSHHNNNHNNYYLDNASDMNSNNSDRNSIESSDSFDIYLPPKQFQRENYFDMSY